MNALIRHGIAAIAMVGFATAGSAQTYSPAGANVTLASSGTVTVSKGITLQCALQGTATIAADGQSVQVTGLSLSGGLCGSVRFTGFPYSLTAGSTNAVTLNNVQVTAITGSCAGSLSGTFDQSTGQITFSNAQVPSTTSGGPCVVNGVVNTSPAVTYTVP